MASITQEKLLRAQRVGTALCSSPEMKHDDCFFWIFFFSFHTFMTKQGPLYAEENVYGKVLIGGKVENFQS